MKSMFITTILGTDRPGIITDIAQAARSLGGEWLTSKVIKLDGQFAAMIRVVIDPMREAEIKEKLENQFADVQFVYAAALTYEEPPSKVINFAVECEDRPGLTKDLNSILSGLDLVVENMECDRLHVSSKGEAIFSAKLTLSIPEGTSEESIAAKIKALSKDVIVNIK